MPFHNALKYNITNTYQRLIDGVFALFMMDHRLNLIHALDQILN